MRVLAFVVMVLAVVACRKEDGPRSVTYKVWCAKCLIEASINGDPIDLVDSAMWITEFQAEPGQSLWLKSTNIDRPSDDCSSSIYIEVDEAILVSAFAADSGEAAIATATVPDHD